MVAVGIILAVAGACLWFGGTQVNSDIERQWSSYWDTGRKDATGDMMIFLGVALVVVGVILFIYGLYKNSKNPAETNPVDEKMKYRCSNCGWEIEGGDYCCPQCNMKIDWNSAVPKDSKDETPVKEAPRRDETKAGAVGNKYCTNCGAILAGAGKFCAKCGRKA